MNKNTETTSVSSVSYVSSFGNIQLNAQAVRDYLVRGNTAVSDQEVMLFIELCKFQKLNPFTNEVYLIKYSSSSPAQIVVGRDAYLRRAYENPDYLGYQSGIVVLRGDDVIQKQGACVYPKETLLGGWCKVLRKLNGSEVETFKEVALNDYNQNQSNWKSKPALMISKVAESQALRAAFPKDYAGLYTAEEHSIDTIETDNGQIVDVGSVEKESTQSPTETTGKEPLTTKEQRQQLLLKAKEIFKGDAVEAIKSIIADMGYESTHTMTYAAWVTAMEKLEEMGNNVIDGEYIEQTPESATEQTTETTETTV